MPRTLADPAYSKDSASLVTTKERGFPVSGKSGTTKPRASRSRASSKPKPAAAKPAASRPKPGGPRVPWLTTPVIVLLLASSMVLGLLVAKGGQILPASWRRPATVHPDGRIIGAEPAPRREQPESAAQTKTGPAKTGEAKVAEAKTVPAKPTAPALPESAPRVAGVLSPQERRARLAQVVLPSSFTTEWGGGAAVLRESANELAQGRAAGGRVALTFDAHFDSLPVDKLLGLLAERGLRATFFVTGAYARNAPESVKKIAAAGHEIANHSDTHAAFTKLSDAKCLAELERAEQSILPLAGAAYRPYWRPPLGDRNLRVLRVAVRNGFLPVYWTIDTLDWRKEATPESVQERISAQGLVGGAIVLQHVGSSASVACLPSEIALFRSHNLVPGCLSELLR